MSIKDLMGTEEVKCDAMSLDTNQSPFLTFSPNSLQRIDFRPTKGTDLTARTALLKLTPQKSTQQNKTLSKNTNIDQK